MIHKHQILALDKFSKYENVIAGFIFNFRKNNETEEITYFQYIDDFLLMVNNINKKSFNEKDLNNYNAIPINGIKKEQDILGILKNFYKMSNKI